MNAEDLIKELQLKAFTGIPVTASDQDGRTYQIKGIEVEHHPDVWHAVTVWLKLDVN